MKKLTRCLLVPALVMALIVNLLPVQAEGLTAERLAQQVQAQVTRHWPHMDRAWPGLDYTQHNLVLLYQDASAHVRAAWVLSTRGMRQLEAGEYQDLPVPQPRGYADITFQGQPSLVMGFDDETLADPRGVAEIYRTATHEIVHFYYQMAASMEVGMDQAPLDQTLVEDVAFLEGPSGRAQPYPVDARPRMYRMMMYRNLVRAYDEPAHADAAIGQASYWFNRWQQEYPEESQNTHMIDADEGMARYIENMGVVVGHENGNPGDHIEREPDFPSADAESYELGFVAALLLNQRQPAWKQDFAQAYKSPLQMLLEGIAAREEPLDTQVRGQVQAMVDRLNADAEVQLTNVLQAQADNSVPWLYLDASQVVSSFSARGNLLVNGEEVFTGFSAEYRAGSGTIRLREATVVMCQTSGQAMLIAVPLTMEHEHADALLTIDTEQVQVNGVQVEAGSQDGRSIYEVKVQDP